MAGGGWAARRYPASTHPSTMHASNLIGVSSGSQVATGRTNGAFWGPAEGSKPGRPPENPAGGMAAAPAGHPGPPRLRGPESVKGPRGLRHGDLGRGRKIRLDGTWNGGDPTGGRPRLGENRDGGKGRDDGEDRAGAKKRDGGKTGSRGNRVGAGGWDGGKASVAEALRFHPHQPLLHLRVSFRGTSLGERSRHSCCPADPLAAGRSEPPGRSGRHPPSPDAWGSRFPHSRRRGGWRYWRG